MVHGHVGTGGVRVPPYLVGVTVCRCLQWGVPLYLVGVSVCRCLQWGEGMGLSVGGR